MKKGQIIEGVIERVDFPNKGIIRTEDGRQVIVKNTIPGQKVSASINKQDVSMPGNVEDVLTRHFHTTGSLR